MLTTIVSEQLPRVFFTFKSVRAIITFEFFNLYFITALNKAQALSSMVWVWLVPPLSTAMLVLSNVQCILPLKQEAQCSPHRLYSPCLKPQQIHVRNLSQWLSVIREVRGIVPLVLLLSKTFCLVSNLDHRNIFYENVKDLSWQVKVSKIDEINFSNT